MNNKRATKRALLTSVMALVMCVVMLVGTTFAWFTDTASTGVNKIQAGNLKVDIVDKEGTTSLDGKSLSFTNINGATDILWEPGVTFRTPGFKIKNDGNLALKYKLALNGVTGSSKLLEVIKFSVVTAGTTDNSFEAVDIDRFEGHLAAGETSSTVLYIQGHMDKNAGNEYQGLELTGLGITVYATQDNVENDSFGPDYDASATYYPVLDAAGMKDALVNGGNIKVDANVDPSEALVATKDTTIDMNGKTIANTNEVWEKNPKSWSLISARESADLTITGNGTFKAKENDSFAVDVQDGATVTIENGTFIGNIHAVYVLKGTAYIKGGFYSVQQKYPDAAKADEFVLNCLDENYEDSKSANIIVTGGTFVNFNPADCKAEGEHTNFVADGYSVISEEHGEDTWYTVVKGTGATAGTQTELDNAITNNETSTVKLTTAGTYELPNLDSKDVTIIGTKDTVIDMKNEVRKASSVSFEGVTVNFGTDNYMGFQHTSPVVYKDCTINGFMTTYGDTVFENCTFNSGNDQYSINFYGGENFTLTNCHFYGVNKNVYIYQETLDSNKNVTFTNCDFHMSAASDLKSAVMLNAANNFASYKYNLVMNGCTQDGANTTAAANVAGNTNYQGLYGLKHVNGSGVNQIVKGTVTINGATVYTH